MEDLLRHNISPLAHLIENKEISPVDIIREILNEISKYNEEYKAYITINEKQAIKEAEKVEEEILNGNYRGLLHGIPISIKDNIHMKNTPITNGAILNRDYISKEDASIVGEIRSQGAIIVGKTNLDEFANNIVGKNKNYGTVKNPFNHNHIAGGSSGGSAVSVALNLAFGSIGTDTSGSIRIPASCCGIYGLKPTHNLFPTTGVTPVSNSLDHVGIMARNSEDLTAMFSLLAPGLKNNNEKTIDCVKGLKIGVLTDYEKYNDAEVQEAMNEIISTFEYEGAELNKVEIQSLENFMENHLTICSTEAYYYHQQFLDEHIHLYEKSNVNFFEMGKRVLQTQYINSLKYKRAMNNDFQNIFSKIDILITPTIPIKVPTFDAFKERWEEELEKMIKYTGPFNMNGLPALSFPYKISEDNLPIGIQLIGAKYTEQDLLKIASWLEKSLW